MEQKAISRHVTTRHHSFSLNDSFFSSIARKRPTTSKNLSLSDPLKLGWQRELVLEPMLDTDAFGEVTLNRSAATMLFHQTMIAVVRIMLIPFSNSNGLGICVSRHLHEKGVFTWTNPSTFRDLKVRFCISLGEFLDKFWTRSE